MCIDRKTAGALAETETIRKYIENGYTFVARNFWYKRMGEIDLILRREMQREVSVLVFCEVKYRKNTDFAPPSAAVTRKKQERIRTLAQIFMGMHRELNSLAMRFDVAEVTLEKGKLSVNILENAF